jgi:thiamine pyrophosphokinase
MRAVIFANGEPAIPHHVPGALIPDDFYIAADGGAEAWLALSIPPEVVIGDFDSLDESVVEELRSQGAKIFRYPPDKDQTDLELALEYAKQIGADHVVVIGGLGGRWDHSLANLFLAANEKFTDLKIEFWYNEDRLFVIHNSAELFTTGGERVSLIPLKGDVKGVVTEGLLFPLNKEALPFGTSRGVSNVATNEIARVSVESGYLLCVISPAID